MVDVRLGILRLLLSFEEDLSVHDIARNLNLPASQIFYHLKKLVEMGVLIREETESRVYYSLQPVFTENPDETKKALSKHADKIVDASDYKIASCLYYFLQLYDVLRF